MATPESISLSNSGDSEQASTRENVALTSENVLTAIGTLDPGKERTAVRLPDGSVVHIATALLMNSTCKEEISASDSPASLDGSVIPILEERLRVDKRVVETGRVVLEKKVLEYEEALDVPLAARSFEIERVVLNQPVEKAPPVRHEGATTIYPLVEERLIITTQLVLKEELRVTQHDTERRDTRTVTLKRETIDVTRTPLT